MDIYEESLKQHKKHAGKIKIESKVSLSTQQDMSIYYSPGVATVSKLLATEPKKAREYTSLNNTVAVISDGSSVLGLGNIGPLGALPVMEGKAVLFKKFANIDAFPIVLATQDPDEIIKTVLNIAPSFGGINLEDIAAPQCFYIEDALKRQLNMPIMHDDQHGTAIVVLAGLINAMKVVKKELSSAKIVVVGAGAAGTAIVKLLSLYASPRMFAVDSKGIISPNRTDLNEEKRTLLKYTNLSGIDGSLDDVIEGADIFIGVSRAGLLTPKMVSSMAKDSIIFALANPEPEIMPDEAKKAGAKIVATGRSDFPNQVNNVLAFPGIFRGALDNQAKITEDTKIKAAEAIASVVNHPTANEIIPSPLNPHVMSAVAGVFKQN
ncbi:NADP-dependent malic enzyme [Candidatus Nomurabacteria bacterium]|nr:NADP-dependent malic enzyme [Candidatus Saccharibacteria bacterium]MCB9839651.1 NADP-dependent malic enzyme [Candidatus Nomurabacteria bacterium]